jgi:pimeloyl-ACP methyl ester carboxylesterase
MHCARWSSAARIGLLATIAVMAATAGLLPTTSRANQKAPPVRPAQGEKVESRVLQAEDGFNVHISYYRSTGDRESPVVVLVHEQDGNRFIWQAEGGLARKLQASGYAVITVDLRYHGESKPAGGGAVGNANQGTKKKGSKKTGPDLKPGDYNSMWQYDLEAVKDFIFKEHQDEKLNMHKLGIVGAGMGASVAAYFAVLDWDKEPYDDAPEPRFQTPRGQDVQALVLISPQEKFNGLVLSKAVTRLKDPDLGIAFLIASGSDPKDKAQADKIFEMAIQPPALNKKRMYQQEYKAKLTGTELLGQKLGLEEHILAFFDEHLKKIDSPWRDRRSKRERLQKKK